MTDGQLDPKPGEGGERPDKISQTGLKTKQPGINPFYFPRLLRTMLLQAYTGQNLFQEDSKIKELSRPKANFGQTLKLTTFHQRTDTIGYG